MFVYSLSSVINFRKQHVSKLAPCTCPQGLGQSPRMQPGAEEQFAEPYTLKNQLGMLGSSPSPFRGVCFLEA